MSLRHHNEIESKYAAEGTSLENFLRFGIYLEPDRYAHVSGPDVYYEQGDNVVRHRHSGGAGELTVKRRTTSRSTTNRREIDLKFSDGMVVADVEAFLLLSGWKKAFTIIKDCYIFWTRPDETRPQASIVMYDAWKLGDAGEEIDRRRFLEVEIEKENDLSAERAQVCLRSWCQYVTFSLNIDQKPLNDSLYELYSGKKYQIANTTK